MEQTRIVGRWIEEGGKVVENEDCLRIRHILETEMKQVAQRDGGWIKLYRSVNSGEYWELDYPQSDMQGGGPPTLEMLALAEVKERYGLVPPTG